MIIVKLIVLALFFSGLVVGVLYLFRSRGLSKQQQKQILDSYNEELKESDRAEAEAQQRMQQNKKEEATSLEELRRASEAQRRELENADTTEQLLVQADKVRHRWNKIKSPWLLGAWIVALAFLGACTPVHAADTSRLVQQIKALSIDLSDCANTLQRERIQHKRQLKDQRANYERRLKQKDAANRQSRKELLVYRSKPPSNTGLKVALWITGGVAVVAIGTAVVFGVVLYKGVKL